MRNKKCLDGAIISILFGIVVMGSCTHKSQVTIATVSFSKDIVPVFQASCALNSSCHLGANNANHEVNLDSSVAYNTILNKHLVIVNNPTASLLYVQVVAGIMPKAPYGALSASQIALILDWIQQGAKNN